MLGSSQKDFLGLVIREMGSKLEAGDDSSLMLSPPEFVSLMVLVHLRKTWTSGEEESLLPDRDLLQSHLAGFLQSNAFTNAEVVAACLGTYYL